MTTPILSQQRQSTGCSTYACRDPDVPRDVGEVQELSAPGHRDFLEALESREIADLPEGAYVSLEIGLDVAAVP